MFDSNCPTLIRFPVFFLFFVYSGFTNLVLDNRLFSLCVSFGNVFNLMVYFYLFIFIFWLWFFFCLFVFGFVFGIVLFEI